MNDVDAPSLCVILAGGRGTRLRSVSGDTPKALMPATEGTVFLDHLIDKLAAQGVGQVILSLCYRGDAFEAYLDSRSFACAVDCIVEPDYLGTGGAIAHVVTQGDVDGVFAVVNGDTLTGTDVRAMFRQRAEMGSEAVVGLCHVEDTERYGAVQVRSGRVVSFEEKGLSSGPGWINNGSYLFHPATFRGRTGTFSLEYDVLPDLARSGDLGAHLTSGPFIDIGIPDDYHWFRQTMAT